MARKTTLSAKNLESLGANRLAELLIEISAGDATAKRRLRLALASAAGPEELARRVSKRLRTIANSRGFVDWSRTSALAKDLDMQRQVIVNDVADADASRALDLLWDFIALAPSVYDRCEDGGSAVENVFWSAYEDLGVVAVKAKPDPENLADLAFAARDDIGFGGFDYLIGILTKALGTPGLMRLKMSLEELLREESAAAGCSSSDVFSGREMSFRFRDNSIKLSLEAIADTLGDVDAYVALQDKATQARPDVATKIAKRLLSAGRAEEALAALDAADMSSSLFCVADWRRVKIDVLDALGRGNEAQDLRMSCFEATLDGEALRAFLKRLPDFDDVEAEQRALDLALNHPDSHTALVFLVQWPALDRADRLVQGRLEELSGDFYDVLSPSADALEAKYPLSATLLRRAMIDFALTNGRSSRYGHAARHLMECDSLASAVSDFGHFPNHTAYRAQLKAEHGRKRSFWEKIA